MISLKERKKITAQLVEELKETSKGDFKGKEVEFYNNYNYLQCIKSPTEELGFIVVQASTLVTQTQQDKESNEKEG